jgi:site-specific DNA-methyltransferase (adenine-specific)
MDQKGPCLPGVFRQAVSGTEKLHVTGKPVEVMRGLVAICPPDGLILDPFAGSGTTIVAALAEDRRAVGIESDPDICLTARRRLGDPGALPTVGGLFAGLA